jgi:hypothetical protein
MRIARGRYPIGAVMSRSAVVAGIATAVVTFLALCLPGTALASPSSHRFAGHYVYTCVKVRDRAKHDTGRICINAYMNPSDLELHYRAKVSFHSISGGKLSRGSAAALYLKLGRRRYGSLRNPRTSAPRGATALKIVTAWIADPHQRTPTAVVKNPCMSWRNGGHACHRGSLSGGIPGFIS